MAGLKFSKFKLTPNGGTKSYYFMARQNTNWVGAIETKTGVIDVSTAADKAEPTCKVSELIRYEKAVRVKIRYLVSGTSKYASILVDATRAGTIGTTLIGDTWGGGTIEEVIGVTRDKFS